MNRIQTRFDELRALKNGWYEDQGVAPYREGLERVAAGMGENYPEVLPLPAIVPTPEGNLLFEWRLPGSPSLDIHLRSMKAYFHAFDADQDDVEHEFDLSQAGSWPRLFDFLAEAAGHRLA